VNYLPRLLLVDTDSLTITKITALFGDVAEVVVAKTGRDALHRFPHERFDIALIDITLPDMSGVTLCAALQLMQPDLRRFLLTDGWAVADLSENLDLCGASGLLIRPIAVETVSEEIDRAIVALVA
jgi:CheY-like chemotaxis protein